MNFVTDIEDDESRKEGLRIVATYRCNRNCKFCYQRNKNSPYLNTDKLEQILLYFQKKQFVPIYITFQGGEITIDPERMFNLIELTNKYYPQVFRKSITSNGTADIEIYRDSFLYGITHLTFSLHGKDYVLERKICKLKSLGFFTVRVNCYAHLPSEKIKYVYDFCKDCQIQLTFCEDLRNVEIEDACSKLIRILQIDDAKIVKHKFQTIVIDKRSKYMFWIYKHLDRYDYNNYIVLPNGKIVTNFDLVIKSYL